MEYTGQLTREDMVNGYRLFNWQKKKIILLIAKLLIIGLAAICMLLFSNLSQSFVLIFCGVIAFLNFFRYLTYKWQIDTLLLKQGTLYLPFSSRIDENGFETKNEKDINVRKWSDFTGWLENEKYFVLLESVGFRVIPKRIITRSEQVAELKNLFQRLLGNAS